jgi:hypothetical protein
MGITCIAAGQGTARLDGPQPRIQSRIPRVICIDDAQPVSFLLLNIGYRFAVRNGIHAWLCALTGVVDKVST